MREATVQPDGQKIRVLRISRELTQEELARKVGCSKRTVENAEAGRRVKRSNLDDIAEALGCVPGDLVSPEGANQRCPLSQLLECALRQLTPAVLVEENPALAANHQAARELFQDVSRLVEQFESQYDELVMLLSESGYERVYGSATRVPRDRVLRANRKLVMIANEMRSIYRGITARFSLAPDLAELLDEITGVCTQIGVLEDCLVIKGVRGGGDFQFDLEQQAKLLDGNGFGSVRDVEGRDALDTGSGEILLRDYNLLLIELHSLKLKLKEHLESIGHR
jgi:transcriptional regulator with XRE-family HTH domain